MIRPPPSTTRLDTLLPYTARCRTVFGHGLGGVRFPYDANRRMPFEGHTTYGALKKKYATGRELNGRTLGILGFGRIGREVAKVAFGMGMDVIAYDLFEFKIGRAHV